jgi:hypothetical protein
MMGDVFERNVGDALAFKAASRVIERACLWVRPARRPWISVILAQIKSVPGKALGARQFPRSSSPSRPGMSAIAVCNCASRAAASVAPAGEGPVEVEGGADQRQVGEGVP